MSDRLTEWMELQNEFNRMQREWNQLQVSWNRLQMKKDCAILLAIIGTLMTALVGVFK